MKTKLLDRNEPRPPSVICPKCGKENMVDLGPFNKNMSEVISDKCLHCRSELHVCIFILANTDMRKLGESMKLVIDTLTGEASNLIIQ
jgi:hypothetical protein